MRSSPAGDEPTSWGVDLAGPEETRRLGALVAGQVRAGDLVVLTGPLGAGKTVFAQGMGDGLGVTEPITSPTFVIARSHTSGRLPLVHVDAYRLGGVAEVDDLDLDSDLQDSVTVVEWGGGVVEHLSESRLTVALDRSVGAADERRVTLTAHDPSWASRLARVEDEWPGPRGGRT